MADKFLILGKRPLFGEVEISGSKNEAGAILAASLLAKETEIDNLPLVSDILNQIEILKSIGAKIEWLSEKKIKIKTDQIDPEKIPIDLFEKMRISVLFLGPFLAKFKRIKIPPPGGDRIGLRPIITHLDAFEQLGVKIKKEGNFYYFEVPKKLEKKRVILKEFSVTATETLISFLATIPQKTRIDISAAEPHVQNLAKFLVKMGTKIEGIGTHTLIIQGKKKLESEFWKIGPDPIETGTFLIAFAITGGEGKIKNTNPEDLIFFLEKMREIGVLFETKKNEIVIKKSKKFLATKIQVLPHPGFPTDLQPQTCVLLTQAEGKSIVHEPLYENRFQHLHELRKMGADIEITDPHRALIFGKKELFGTKVNSSDIRSGASLVLAGLIAKGETIVENISQIDRGYEKLDEKLKKLGAEIKRI
ncbi:UDP-N-acetylglucosamine 1-carboxyvinyltransferase [Candidatus Parcubacteria bacterium]|nr:UDP-N-acetylglucosamine 1-carboxyvinyltransferase [Candidatus Parcubacteria bacterium]